MSRNCDVFADFKPESINRIVVRESCFVMWLVPHGWELVRTVGNRIVWVKVPIRIGCVCLITSNVTRFHSDTISTDLIKGLFLSFVVRILYFVYIPR